VNLRLTFPEVWTEATLNLQMVELQLDGRNALRKIAAHVVDADMESSNSMAFGLCENHHKYLLFNSE
jgi:hypothetical protein